MNRKILLNNNRGLTLVEIIVVMVIMGVIITAIASFFLSSNRVFTLSKDQRNVQSEVRLALDQILLDIRYAKEVELITVEAAKSPEPGYNYIYMEDGSIHRCIYDEDTSSWQENVVIGSFLDAGSSFNKVSGNPDSLKIIVASEEQGNQTYTLDSTIKLPNLSLNTSPDLKMVKGANASGLAIKYKPSSGVLSSD